MQLREAASWISLHPNGLNNNQLSGGDQRHPAATELIDNRNESSTPANEAYASTTSAADCNNDDESGEFRVAEYTATWSSLAIARDNIHLSVARNINNNNNNNNNNNLTKALSRRSSSLESLADYEGRNSSRADSSAELSPSDWSDWSEDGNLPAGCRGIVNPNYPGFQHLAPSLLSDTDFTEDECEPCVDYDKTNAQNDEYNNNRNNIYNVVDESINHLCGYEGDQKSFYEKPKFSIQTVTSMYDPPVPSTEKCMNYVNSVENCISDQVEGLVSSIEEEQTRLESIVLKNSNEKEVPVQVEIVELTTSIKECPKYPEIEEIADSGKSSETSESEDIIVEQIDLIREAKELPLFRRAKINNRSANEDSESECCPEEQITYTKLDEIDLLSSIGRDIGVDLEKYVQPVPDVVAMEQPPERMKENIKEDTNKLMDSEFLGDARKKEKMARNQAAKRRQQQQQHQQSRSSQKRFEKRRPDNDSTTGDFDVFNIETAMPKIDLDAIESHLKAAREEERRDDDDPKETQPSVHKTSCILEHSTEIAKKLDDPKDHDREDLIARFDRIVKGETLHPDQRRNDREEIRRRLAMGPDADDLRSERGRKPSLQSRLQSGMNLQICFMNETSSDTESPSSESDSSTEISMGKQQMKQTIARPQVLNLPPLRLESGIGGPLDEADFFARQARLQTEARMALAQAKEMAHMQMEVERQRLKQSPITEMVRCSLEKVGVQLGEDRRRLSRALLTELNVAQLQVVANDLHARIAALNEALVEGLLRRDDLHMEQDSMLVDVEDLTRYLGAKQETMKKKQSDNNNQVDQQRSQSLQQMVKSTVKAKLANRSLVALVRK